MANDVTMTQMAGMSIHLREPDQALGTAQRGEIKAEELQDMMAGGQELAELEGSLGGTV